jgi:ADP-dependent NAD(P)H-hydrate dehydratase / NAD(P)H-hydrate epimerase
VRPLDLPLLTAADARAADADAVADGETPDTLMARAAGHLARTIIAVAGRAAGLRVDLVVGRGDNGGDGWATAPLLAARGAHVRVLVPDGATVATSDASSRARERWLAAGGAVHEGPVRVALLHPDGSARADVVVDCLLGTGSTGPLRGSVVEAAAAIRAARDGGARIVACDVPTGVCADDGTVVEGAVIADATITFGALKRGLLLAPGSACCGRRSLGRLGPRFAAAERSRWRMLTFDGARPVSLDRLTEKRRRGVVLVVAGRTGCAGAAALAGRGALAAGAGLVTVAVPEPVRAEVATMHPALMTVGLPADADGGLHADAVHALPLDGIDAVVVGPGLGTGAGAAAVVAHLRATCGRLVLDADALNVHRGAVDLLAVHPRGVGTALVVTPHERELDRLAGDGAYRDRSTRVPELAARLEAHVVAKGPGTLNAAPDGTVHVSPFAVPALATAGTGDVLAGMLGAALAGWDPDERDDSEDPDDSGALARRIARTVWWHAAAGLLAGSRSAERIDALAVLGALPEVLARLARTPGVREDGTRDPGPSGRLDLDLELATLLAPVGAAPFRASRHERVGA